MNRRRISLFLMLLLAFSCALSAQDHYREIERYDPETDPQVNFPQVMIDEATGVAPADGTPPASGDAGPGTEGTPTVTPAQEGTLGARLVQAAAEIYRTYAEPHSFPYLPETENGNKGCAQVVNHIFEAAGVPIVPPGYSSGSNDYYARIRVKDGNNSRHGTIDRLKEQGWVEVTPPPYQAGDVITWRTTSRDDSHIGIIMANGNNVRAISNSSEYGRPRFHPAGPEYAPMSRLLRKVG